MESKSHLGTHALCLKLRELENGGDSWQMFLYEALRSEGGGCENGRERESSPLRKDNLYQPLASSTSSKERKWSTVVEP
ncbi:hypothetical protein AVEN_49591-1 [Araneus ventricosus]|uniref:Uncharacterized protein n=1 Tax=Araneus ventricosus TaxID=182803 RepID=A0A4Y2XB26_ARAVE|nr:hypothetical protein AVEN_49591-1 [Araneus ventricosus]